MIKQLKIEMMKYITVITLTLVFSSANAQQFETAVTEIQKIQKAYSVPGYISFTVKYLYARETAPSKTLDSLSFYYKMKGKNFHCKTDKIEFLQNDSVNLAIYHNEKTIILSNPSSNIEQGRLSIDNWDSAFIAANIDTVYFSEKNSTKTLHFHFTPESIYSKYSIAYNRNTYRPTKITYIEKATQQFEDGQSKPNGIQITMLFSSFSKAVFNESLFNEQQFISKQTSQWSASSKYSGYTIVNHLIQE